MLFHPEKAFFKSDTRDPYTDLPIYVFDSNYLPNLSNTSFDKKTCDSIIFKCFKRIIARIPKHPYSMVCFTSGFKNVTNHSNSWVTMLKCYQLLPDPLRSNLKKIFIVHESWLIRSFTQIMVNVLQIKIFKTSSVNGGSYDKLIYCKNLTELSKHLDITKIRISLDVYLYDCQFTEKLIIPYTVKQTSHDYLEYKNLIMEKVSNRLSTEGLETELVLTKPGQKQKLFILIDAIERMNYLDLSQWDIYCMGSLFLHSLRTHTFALIPIEQITLPIEDSYEYTLQTFRAIVQENGSLEILAGVLDIATAFIRSEETKHDIKSITKTLIPALAKEKVSLKTSDKLSIGQRFLKNLLINWESIRSSVYMGSKKRKQPEPPASRKVSGSKEPVIVKREPRQVPEVPKGRKSSISSTISFDFPSTSSLENKGSEQSSLFSSSLSSFSKSQVITENHIFQEESEQATEIDEKRILSDIASSLNKQKPPSSKKGLLAPETKFSDGYSSIEGQKKVNKLAKLYEERLKGLEVLKEIDLN